MSVRRTHYWMYPDVSWRNGSGCPPVVHCWADLQSVHGFHCYDNIARMQNVSECLYLLCAWFMTALHADALPGTLFCPEISHRDNIVLNLSLSLCVSFS